MTDVTFGYTACGTIHIRLMNNAASNVCGSTRHYLMPNGLIGNQHLACIRSGEFHGSGEGHFSDSDTFLMYSSL